MPVTRCIQIALALGLCLLIVPVRWPARARPGALVVAPAVRVARSPLASPFEAALQEAKTRRLRAREAAKQEMEAREARDPAAADVADAEAWGRGVLALDRGGDLRCARDRARQAEKLARTSAEAAQAAELLVLLECEAGHHAAELRQARRLVALQHGSRRSLMVLRRAAVCNGQAAMARQTSATLATMEGTSPVDKLSSAERDTPDVNGRSAFTR
jgi:hypothetical protein